MLSRTQLLALFLSPGATGFNVNFQSVFHSHGSSTVRTPALYAESNDVASDSQSESEDFFLEDDASTTSQFLAGLWQTIAKGNTMVRGVSVDVGCSMNESTILD